MDMTHPLNIFRVGRHTAMSGATLNFTEADLAATAQAYDPAIHEAPIVVGHPAHDDPAYGWVSRVEAIGDTLQAQPHQVEEQFAELVSAGRYKKISASFYTPDSPANPVPGVYYLRHVGFLGAQPPAVKGLKQAEFADGEDGVVQVEVEFAESDAEEALFGRFVRWLRERIPADDATAFAEALSTAPWKAAASDYASAEAYCSACLVDENKPGQPKTKSQCHLPIKEPGGKVNRHALYAAQGALVGARGGVDLPADVKRAAAKKLVELLKAHKLPPAASLMRLADFSENGATETMTPEEIAAKEAEQQAREAQFAEREAALVDRERKARRSYITEFVEQLVKEGKVLPRDQAGLVEFMDSIGADVVVEFAEGATTVKKPATEWLNSFLSNLPPAIDYGERGNQQSRERVTATVQTPPGYGVRQERAELHAQALAYSEKHSVSYIQAVEAIERGQ
ncbi:hypothetical protein [Acidihalobacter prosperus]|uniref:Peptidase n=1 Tax=Acidihalobacter prosperus TaxID=160660 RepID=A0A1A6C899_9GAMM|nr:hypothetical protein [Acidihalobacter prosperus]OBS10793.1 hypothetical protein Thpro_020509 [Acidihalobacter prosperus]